MIIDKDYAITGWSILQMNTGDGYVLVNGSFKTSSYSSEQGYLTTGRLEVKGNITQVAGGNGQQYNFYQSGSFTVIISGDEVSTVTITNVDNSPFNIIDTSKSAGVKFQTAIRISKIEGLQNVIDGLTIQNSNIIVDKDEIVNCNLSLNGVTLNLNGHKLTVVGNLNQNSTIININSGSLIVNKDYTITGWSILQMNSGEGHILVNGSFKTSAYSSEQGYLTTGILEVKGNITQITGGNGQQYNFYQSGSFKVIISGDEVSTVTIASVDGSPFNIIDTSKSAGVKFQTAIKINKIEGLQSVIDGLTIQNSNIVLDNDEIVNCDLKLYNSSVKLDGYEFIVMGNLTILNGSIDLNGNELSVYKSFYQKEGTVNLNGGTLYIGEDYIIQGTSRLNMTNEWDYVYVTGNFKTSTSLSHQGYLSNGILEVMGDFTQEGNAYSFATSGNHEVILSGSEIQTVHFQNPQTSYFSNIDTKYSAGINCTYNVNYNVISLISSLSGSSFILDIIDTLDALGIDNIISLLNIATNIFMNENGMQYITKEDIGKFVLGICDAIDDNVLLGLGQKISALFDKFSPYDDLYYMYGKVFGDEIFLASFIYIGGAAAIDAATAFGLAAGSAGLGLALSETGIGFVVGEGVAAVALVDALAATVVSALCAVGVANSGIVLSEDIQKLEDLKKESSKVTKGAESIKWKGFSKGELAEHFAKHGNEFGDITQNQYLKLAKDFAAESNSAFRETKVGNFIIKYDEATRRVLVGQGNSREIRTFYKADFRDADPFEAAVNLAKQLSGIK